MNREASSIFKYFSSPIFRNERRIFIFNWNSYYKSGQLLLLQTKAEVLKIGAELLQIAAAFPNRGRSCFLTTCDTLYLGPYLQNTAKHSKT